MSKPKTVKDISPITIWNTCIDLGIYHYCHAPEETVTLSHGFLKLVLTLYEKYEPKSGEFASKQEKLIGAIKTAVVLLVERSCKTDLDKHLATACGLLGFLTLLKADAEHDGEKKVVKAADQMLQHGSSATFDLKAVVKHLKRMIQAREEAD